MDIDQDRSYSSSDPLAIQTTEDKEMGQSKNFSIPFVSLIIKLISFQADIIYNCIIALLSPFLPISSSASESFPQVEDTKQNNVESAYMHHEGNNVSGNNNNIISILVRRIGFGFLSAAYVCMLLVFVMTMAVILGGGLVRLFVEQPVSMREHLSFDYSEVHPTASFLPRGGDGGGFVPVGHTLYVSLHLLIPESDYNIDVGVFQLMAELIGKNGAVTARSSHPCMLRYRSWPIRTFHTFFMVLPLLLGLTSETQRLSIPILQHKEGFPRTDAIRVSIIPRAGTSYLPQVYEAEILVNSQLPWKKELLRRWKWTFCVWISFYIYIILLMLLFFFFKPLAFPLKTTSYNKFDASSGLLVQPTESGSGEREVSEMLRRTHQKRNKSIGIVFERGMAHQPADSSSSDITFRRDDASTSLEEDIGDSESVCLGGR